MSRMLDIGSEAVAHEEQRAWILLYLSFVLSGVFSSLARISGYHGTFQTW